jgi:hypothetical protein
MGEIPEGLILPTMQILDGKFAIGTKPQAAKKGKGTDFKRIEGKGCKRYGKALK